MLAEGRHPTRAALDAVSTTRPVLAIHQSFHLGAVNSRGLRELGCTRASADPDGGVIRRRPGPVARPFGEPNGVLEETAFSPASEKATVHSAADANSDANADDPVAGLEVPTDYQWHGCC
ncbi:amidohydrolase family protein [Kitasatospora sp. NPDC054795]